MHNTKSCAFSASEQPPSCCWHRVQGRDTAKPSEPTEAYWSVGTVNIKVTQVYDVIVVMHTFQPELFNRAAGSISGALNMEFMPGILSPEVARSRSVRCTEQQLQLLYADPKYQEHTARLRQIQIVQRRHKTTCGPKAWVTGLFFLVVIANLTGCCSFPPHLDQVRSYVMPMHDCSTG